MLGHHHDDILKTFFLNLFQGGRVCAMQPKLLNEEGDLLVLRLLALMAEADCAKRAAAMRFPIILCDPCGSQKGLQRAQVKTMLDGWDRRASSRRQVKFNALANVRPSQLPDPNLFDFAALWPRNATGA